MQKRHTPDSDVKKLLADSALCDRLLGLLYSRAYVKRSVNELDLVYRRPDCEACDRLLGLQKRPTSNSFVAKVLTDSSLCDSLLLT